MENFLPGFDKVNTVDTGTRGSLQQAARPWGELGSVGHTLTQIGDRGVEVAVRQKEIETKRKAAEMEMAYQQLEADYKKQMLSNPNMTTEQASEGWQKASSQFLQQYNGEHLSPMERDTIGLRAQALAQRGGINVTETAMLANIERGKLAAKTMIERGEQTGDYEMVDNGYSMLGTFEPVEVLEAMKPKTYRNMARAGLLQDINEDPLGSAAMFKDEKTFLEMNPELTSDDYYDGLGRQQAAQNAYYNRRLDDFSEYVAKGELTDPNKVGEFFPEMAKHSPAWIANAQDLLIKRREMMMETKKNDPAWQVSRAEVLMGMVENWPPSKKIGADWQKAAIVNMADTELGKGSAWHKMVMDAISSKEGMVETANKDYAQVKFEGWQRNFERDNQSKATIKQTVDSAAKTGFLKPSRLKSMGFSDEQAKEIGSLYTPYEEGGKLKYSDPKEAAAAIKSQLETFRALYPKRPNKTGEGLTKYEKEMAEAIYQGKTGTVEVVNDFVNDQYLSTIGKMRIEFNQWAAQYPEKAKDDKAVDSWFTEKQKGMLRAQAQGL